MANWEIPKRWRYTAYPTGVQWESTIGDCVEDCTEYRHPKHGVVGCLVEVRRLEDGEFMDSYWVEYDSELV